MPGFELVGKEELEEIQKMFDKGKGNLYRYGPDNHAVRELEKRFCEKFGVKYAHGVSSGTAAIHSALAAVGVSKGDEVITTAFTFVAPVEAICALGAIPVPVEIDETYHLDPIEVEKSITPRTKAIIAIPMWASPKMDEIIKICDKKGVVLVEDSAQCLGGSYKGSKLGTLGKIGTFSFDMGKTMTTGEGGMIITDDEELYKKAAEFSDHGHMHLPDLPRGQDPRRVPGLNYRMSELTGAVGLAQLSRIDYALNIMKKNKHRIKESISDIPDLNFRKFADEEGSLGDTLIFSLPDNEAALNMAKLLAEKGFNSKILPEAFEWHFAGSWNHIFENISGYDKQSLSAYWPKTYELLSKSIALPIFINMPENLIHQLVDAIEQSANQIFK